MSINKLFNNGSYKWDVVEFFNNDKDLMDGVGKITEILNLDANNIEGKIIWIDRVKHEVKVGFKNQDDRKIYMLGSDKYVCSYGRSYNLTSNN